MIEGFINLSFKNYCSVQCPRSKFDASIKRDCAQKLLSTKYSKLDGFFLNKWF